MRRFSFLFRFRPGDHREMWHDHHLPQHPGWHHLGRLSELHSVHRDVFRCRHAAFCFPLPSVQGAEPQANRSRQPQNHLREPAQKHQPQRHSAGHHSQLFAGLPTVRGG